MVFHVILAMKRLLQYIYLFATLTTLVAACAEDDTFTQSAAYRLAFSTDTVRLDTTFSNVPTATRTFGCSIGQEPMSVVPECVLSMATKRASV